MCVNIFYSFFVITVLAFGLVSTPFSFAQSNSNTNLGQEVSKFVHETRELFEQQGAETKTVIAQCREDMANAEPSERESVRDTCKSNLDDIRESYKLLRETYREAFLIFKENMKIFIAESRGLPIDSTQRDAAIANIKALDEGSEKRELLRELKQKMNEQIREDAQKQREQEKREREIAREELKAEKKEEHKALKIDQEKQREQEKNEREAQRESKTDSQDDDYDEDFIIKGIVDMIDLVAESFTLDSDEVIYVNKNTKFDDFDSLEDIQDFAVKVEVIQSSNSLIAKEIEIEDESHDDDHDEEIEIEVEVEDGVAKVKVEYNDHKEEFEIKGDVSQDAIAALILDLDDFPLETIQEIKDIWEFEIEDEEDDEDEDES